MGKTTQVLIQKQKAESCNTVTQQLIRYDSLFFSPACGKFRFEIGISYKVTSYCVIVFSWFLHIILL